MPRYSQELQEDCKRGQDNVHEDTRPFEGSSAHAASRASRSPENLSSDLGKTSTLDKKSSLDCRSQPSNSMAVSAGLTVQIVNSEAEPLCMMAVDPEVQVFALKHDIERQFGQPMSHQQLLYDGMELNNQDLISSVVSDNRVVNFTLVSTSGCKLDVPAAGVALVRAAFAGFSAPDITFEDGEAVEIGDF